jgi:hypothetical protein
VKKLVIFAALMLFSSQIIAMPAVTKGGHVACLKKEWLNDMVSFVVAKDKGSFQAYVDSGKCLILKAGLRVTVTESPGMFGGTAGFVFKGMKFWTVREGLEYNP